jgi:hypothetical protein
MARKKAFRKLLELLKTVPGCAPAVMVKTPAPSAKLRWSALLPGTSESKR